MNNYQDGRKEGERKPVISPEKIQLNAPDLGGANVWGDLLTAAIESVDFYTLAALYLDDYEDWERAKASAASA